MPGPLRESHKIVIKGPAAAGEDLTRSWDKNLPRASQKSFHTSTSNTWRLQDLHARTSLGGSYQVRNRSSDKDVYEMMQERLREDLTRRRCQQDLHKIFSERPVQDHAKTSERISSGSSQEFSQAPLQDLVKTFIYDAPWNPCKSVLEGHCRELIRSLYQDPRKFAKISTAPQRERSDTHKVPRCI